MKKNSVKMLLAGFAAAISISAGTARAQQLADTPNTTYEEAIATALSKDDPSDARLFSTPVDRTEIKEKAWKNFHKNYKNAGDVKWLRVNSGFVACFRKDGVKTAVFYDKNGSFDCSISYYSEDKLPADVRHLVKTNFYDDKITFVTEVKKDGITAYVVKLEDKTTIKSVKVIGGEWELMEEFTKAR